MTRRWTLSTHLIPGHHLRQETSLGYQHPEDSTAHLPSPAAEVFLCLPEVSSAIYRSHLASVLLVHLLFHQLTNEKQKQIESCWYAPAPKLLGQSTVIFRLVCNSTRWQAFPVERLISLQGAAGAVYLHQGGGGPVVCGSCDLWTPVCKWMSIICIYESYVSLNTDGMRSCLLEWI